MGSSSTSSTYFEYKAIGSSSSSSSLTTGGGGGWYTAPPVSSRCKALTSIDEVWYLSSRATLVCLAFCRPRPMADPLAVRSGAAEDGGPGIRCVSWSQQYRLRRTVPTPARRVRGHLTPRVGRRKAAVAAGRKIRAGGSEQPRRD